MDTLAQVARHYRRIAAPYGLLARTGLWPPQLRKRAVAALRLPAGGRVLDIGCGTSASFGLLRKAVGDAGAVVGIEYVPEMLEYARKNSQRYRVQLVRADAGHLPLQGEFDGVLFCLSFFVIPDSFAALESAWKLLHPGGRVVIADGKYPVSPDGEWASRGMARVIARTRFEPLLRTRSIPALREWFAAREVRCEWEQWWGGVFFTCGATRVESGRAETGR